MKAWWWDTWDPGTLLWRAQGEFSALVEHQLATSGGAPGQPQQQQQQQQEEVPGALLALPHALVGFNMGLTCQDYSWAPTLKAIRRWAPQEEAHGWWRCRACRSPARRPVCAPQAAPGQALAGSWWRPGGGDASAAAHDQHAGEWTSGAGGRHQRLGGESPSCWRLACHPILRSWWQAHTGGGGHGGRGAPARWGLEDRGASLHQPVGLPGPAAERHARCVLIMSGRRPGERLAWAPRETRLAVRLRACRRQRRVPQERLPRRGSALTFSWRAAAARRQIQISFRGSPAGCRRHRIVPSPFEPWVVGTAVSSPSCTREWPYTTCYSVRIAPQCCQQAASYEQRPLRAQEPRGSPGPAEPLCGLRSRNCDAHLRTRPERTRLPSGPPPTTSTNSMQAQAQPRLSVFQMASATAWQTHLSPMGALEEELARARSENSSLRAQLHNLWVNDEQEIKR